MLKWFKSDKSHEARLDEAEQHFQEKLQKMKEDKQKAETAARDVYRVGITNDGRTTLTLVEGYTNMTLSMTPEACERLIGILRATYEVEETAGTEQ
jgi:hypothetical protein